MASVHILKHVWQFDCNPKELRYDEQGNPRPFPIVGSPRAIRNPAAF